jgi:hypothetical protein
MAGRKPAQVDLGDEEIIKALRSNRGSVQFAARELDISEYLLRAHCSARGIDLGKIRREVKSG